MNTSAERMIKVTSFLLLAVAITQILYTGLHVAGFSVPRQLLWGMEAILFTFLAAFAGAALAQATRHHLLWSAIAMSAVFNLVQVSVGLTMFGPVRAAANNVDGLAPLAGAVVAFSFVVYYAAKLLLGLAALNIGISKLSNGTKVLGGVTVLFGGIAVAANAASIAFGRDVLVPSAVAGSSGTIATLLLALCLLKADGED